jgi:biotin carboxylase
MPDRVDAESTTRARFAPEDTALSSFAAPSRTGTSPTGPPAAIFSRPSNCAAPSILLVATLRWPTAARLAISFAQMGCRVEAICPREHACVLTRAVQRIHAYDNLRPLPALRAAIETAAPDLIIPCDDRAAGELHRLYELAASVGGRASALQAGIRRSLGSPVACARVMERNQLGALAFAENIRAPPSARLACAADLDIWLDEHKLPAVIKIDGSWGGHGVRVVQRRDEAHEVFRRMLARPSVMHCLARALLERDSSHLLSWFGPSSRALTVQAFIGGQPANRAVACWQGKVLAGISVEAVRTQHRTGPATVVKVIENPEMAQAAERLVRRLGVSGLWGIDFILDAGSGAAYMIEINPRATPICHLPLGPGRDLPAALYRQLAGATPRERPAVLDREHIALFPGEWQRDPASSFLDSSHHDIPWKEPGLIRDCIAVPWAERGWMARSWARLRRPRIGLRPARAPQPPEEAADFDVQPESAAGTRASGL